MQLLGRRKIYTDVSEITEKNIVSVLKKAYAVHVQNRAEIEFLLNYEKGVQPIVRPKVVRPEIDIRIKGGLPNYIKKFHIGYFWGSPILLRQRGDNEVHETSGKIDSQGISALNEMLKNADNIGYLDQCMAEFIEIGGIGHRFVDIKTRREFKEDVLHWTDEGTYTGSLANIYNLDSRYAFCVYLNAPGQKKMLGVSYIDINGRQLFTCFSNKERFDVDNGELKSAIWNPMGAIPIIEYERSFDRMGCFERCIDEIDGYNILVSDYHNDSSQRTQEMWWGDNVDFKEDENGEIEKPKSGDWVLTNSVEGRKAQIQPLTSTYDSTGSLNAIEEQRRWILKSCDVPTPSANGGNNTSGVATDIYTGYSATEIAAKSKQQMIDKGKREELDLINRAIRFVPESVLPLDSPIRKVHTSDVEFRYDRREDYDMASQFNSFATALDHGIHGRHALRVIKSLPDIEQVWIDSRPLIEAYQRKQFADNETEDDNVSDKRTQSDMSDQTENSPILKGGI